MHLEDAWEKYQRAIVEAWRVAGADSSSFLLRLGGLYEAEANIRFREKHQRTWEKHRMAKQDNGKHQTRGGRARGDRGPDGQCKRWERQRMVMQDKNEHRPRRFREWRRKAQVDHDDKFAALIKLLLRWGRLLKEDAAFAKRERQKVVRQHMKDKKERKRFEVSEKRRLRAEERLRRENLRKTMKSDLIFLDLGKKVLGEK